jgi:hypothetical protein
MTLFWGIAVGMQTAKCAFVGNQIGSGNVPQA